MTLDAPPLTYLDVIQETVDYYKVAPARRRSVELDPRGQLSCLYLSSNGARCAVGRCVDDAHRNVLRAREGQPARVLLSDEGQGVLSPQYRHLGDHLFWEDLQYLHDHAAFWTATDLSELGYHYVVLMCHVWKSGRRSGARITPATTATARFRDLHVDARPLEFRNAVAGLDIHNLPPVDPRFSHASR